MLWWRLKIVLNASLTRRGRRATDDRISPPSLSSSFSLPFAVNHSFQINYATISFHKRISLQFPILRQSLKAPRQSITFPAPRENSPRDQSLWKYKKRTRDQVCVGMSPNLVLLLPCICLLSYRLLDDPKIIKVTKQGRTLSTARHSQRVLK